MKIIFFGTSEFALPALDALFKAGLEPAVVVTSPDRAAGRGLETAQSSVKQAVAGKWLILLQPEKIDEEVARKIYEIRPDIGIAAAYGKILPKELIDIFPKGILNIHPSLLPKYRGASPLEFTILAGEENNTGVTIIKLDEKIDHGPIVAQRIWKGQGVATYSQLHDALAKLGAELLLEVLPQWMAGKLEPVPQNESQATFTRLIKKENGKIDWSQNAEYIERMTRAYEKWPGTYTEFGSKILKIIKVEVIDRHLTMQPGIVFEKNGFPCVACGERALKLLVVQPEGKTEMPGDAYLRGHGEILA